MPSKVLSSLKQGINFSRSLLFDRRLPVAYLGGWLGKKNLGDEALFSAYRALFPEINFVPFDGGRVSQHVVRYLPHLKSGILGGGTLIGQKPIWLEIPNAFLNLHSRLDVFGTGVEEPLFWNGESTLDKWKILLERCGYIGVRGPRSAELLSEIGISNVEVVGDPVLTFAVKDVNLDFVPNSVGLNIGTSDGNVWGNEPRICDEMAKFATIARKAGWKVEWFVVWPKDLEITLKAARASGTYEHIHTIFEDHEQFIEKARMLNAFIGMKLHATVLATCALTPSIMLEYRPKCRDYMDSIGQGHLTFKTSEFNAGELWEIVADWGRRRTEAAKTLSQSVHSRQRSQKMAAQKITSLLKSL